MWSKTKKRLEELLCDDLKGRVDYFITRYHCAPDQYGRFCIRIDGKEYLQANPYNERYSYEVYTKLKKENQVPPRDYIKGRFINDEMNTYYEDLAYKQMIEEGKFEIFQIFDAINEYLNQDITSSIQSENEIVFALALLDRRVGKRTLDKIQSNLKQYPLWIQDIYYIRVNNQIH